jgi:2',3'-cyclic-nucleotide 2'-phosphodiesterase (5'-nucleotidase family)
LRFRRVILWAVALGLINASPAAAKPRSFVIFHTSDIHGAIAGRTAKWDKSQPNRMVGGFPALAALVKKEKLPYLLLDSGDIFQGTPEGNLTRGRAVIEAMNALRYTAMAIGNHEYDYGEDNLRALARLATFPMLGANIRRKKDKKRVDYAGARHMVEIAGVKVGLVGIATRHTATSTLPKNVAHLIFDDEAKTARRHALTLRKQGADVVVILAHCGLAPSMARKRLSPNDVFFTASDEKYAGDRTIARGAPVDLVLGGHMHIGLSRPWRDPKSGVYIVQSYENLQAVSRLMITVDKEAEQVVKVDGALIDLWVDQTGEDPNVLGIVRAYQDQVGKQLSEEIGEIRSDMLRAGSPLDNPLGSWMADVMRIAAAADIGVQNTFGVRDDLRAGKVTLRDVYKVMPFENTVVVVTLSGKQVKQLIRDNIRGRRSGIQISGIQVHLFYSADGNRLDDLWVLHRGAPIDEERQFRVATNNYLAQGGTGGKVMIGAPVRDTGRSIRDVLIEAVRQHSPIQAPGVGRFKTITKLPR